MPEADDPRKMEFYKILLPAMLKPRRFAFTLRVEAMSDFQAMEAMSHQVVLADDDTLDMLLAEAEEIVNELDSIEDIIHEDAAGIADVIAARWPFQVSVSLTSTGPEASGNGIPPVIEG